MKAVLIVVALVVVYIALKDGLFASLTSGAPSGAFGPPLNGRGVYVQTPWGNFGGNF